MKNAVGPGHQHHDITGKGRTGEEATGLQGRYYHTALYFY